MNWTPWWKLTFPREFTLWSDFLIFLWKQFQNFCSVIMDIYVIEYFPQFSVFVNHKRFSAGEKKSFCTILFWNNFFSIGQKEKRNVIICFKFLERFLGIIAYSKYDYSLFFKLKICIAEPACFFNSPRCSSLGEKINYDLFPPIIW